MIRTYQITHVILYSIAIWLYPDRDLDPDLYPLPLFLEYYIALPIPLQNPNSRAKKYTHRTKFSKSGGRGTIYRPCFFRLPLDESSSHDILNRKSLILSGRFIKSIVATSSPNWERFRFFLPGPHRAPSILLIHRRQSVPPPEGLVEAP